MKKIILFTSLILLSLIGIGQRECGYVHPPYDEEQERQISEFINRQNRDITTPIVIPVVFHIVWKTGYPAQNVSDARIMSQLEALNRDFNLLNTDASNTPSIFTPSNPNIQFCLATRDPNGNATTGIIRRETSVGPFNPGNTMSYYRLGGSESWTANTSLPELYLNIYVCDLSSNILGAASYGGVVAIDYSVCGITNMGSYGLGRSLTHEVGHWLNLRHIWGSGTCGDDLVGDTPQHNAANYGCPTYPHYSTCTGTPIEMTMNYMDYTNDACMFMFSQGQVDRMRASFAAGGWLTSIPSSIGCQPPTYTDCIVKNLGVTVPVLNSARIAWTPVTGATSYTLQYSTLLSFTEGYYNSYTVTGTDTTMVLTPTSTSTSNTYMYFIRVKANCSSNSTWAPWILVKTNENVGVMMLDPVLTGGSSGGTGGTGGGTGGGTVPCQDPNETNNTLATAKSISVNSDVIGSIVTLTDVDWFKFSCNGQQKNVQVILSNLTTNYDVELYNSSNTLIGGSANLGSSNESIIANGLANGTYYVKIYSPGGVFDPLDCYTIRVNRSNTAFRLEEEVEDGNFVYFNLYPNPTNGHLTLNFVSDIETQYVLEIFDFTSKRIFSKKYTSNFGNNFIDVEFDEFSKGVYTLLMYTDKKRYVNRVVKQ